MHPIWVIFSSVPLPGFRLWWAVDTNRIRFAFPLSEREAGEVGTERDGPKRAIAVFRQDEFGGVINGAGFGVLVWLSVEEAHYVCILLDGAAVS